MWHVFTMSSYIDNTIEIRVIYDFWTRQDTTRHLNEIFYKSEWHGYSTCITQNLLVLYNTIFSLPISGFDGLWEPATTVTMFSHDFLRCQSIHFNESRTPPDLSLESGHGITSLPFWLGYAYSINCACLYIPGSLHNGRSPAYLVDMMTATADLPGRERLRSANSFRYETPKLKLKFGERFFSYAGPIEGVELTSFQSPGTNEHWYF